MSRLFSLAWLILLLPVLAPGEPALPGVGAAMQAEVDAHEIAGAVTLVTTKDKIIHLEATGLADIATNRAMEPEAMFWLASMTKMFTGVAVLMLQDEGRLNVDDPVAKYIPEFASITTATDEPLHLTIAQLLSHTSGLTDIKRSAYPAAKDLSQLIKGYFPAPPLQAEPGGPPRYNSFGFDVAGRVVEAVSGKSFDAFLQERLFDPLGMKDTTFYPTAAQQLRLASNYRKNRGTGRLELQPTMYGLAMPVRGQFPPVPGGGLFSTAGDLARFCQMLLNRGTRDGRRYLSEAAFEMLTTNRTGDQPTPDRGWGLGVYVVHLARPGAPGALPAGAFGHAGALGTHIMIDPTKGLGYVLLLHRNNFANEPTRLFLQAATAALEKPSLPSK